MRRGAGLGIGGTGILPVEGASSAADEEKHLVESGAMKLPAKRPDWDSSFSLPKGNLAKTAAVRAVIDSRDDR